MYEIIICAAFGSAGSQDRPSLINEPCGGSEQQPDPQPVQELMNSNVIVNQLLNIRT